jgi:radical SAM enzyme (TIGR01210 family)
MKRNPTKSFLNLVCARIKKNRPVIQDDLNYSYRIEQIAGLSFVSLWFRTRGCRHDYMGGCTMCNYGKSTTVEAGEMIEYVKAGLSFIPNNKDTILLVETSGSMLDEWEVPAQAREGILRLVHNHDCRSFLCETRIETITDDKIKQYTEILGDKNKCVEVGLESSNPWISKYCINKDLSFKKYGEGMAILRRHQVLSIANVIVGSPFLSPKEAIDDAVETIRWAFSHGTDSCVVFPVHVKRWTLVEWLWKHDQYSPVSLWSLIEVLNELGPELAQRVTISWYKTYIEQSTKGVLSAANDWGYLSSPTTCPSCYSKVINLLDTYRDTNDFSVMVALTNMSCTCKNIWRSTLEKKELLSLPERAASAYESVGRDILGDRWWNENASVLLNEMMGSFETERSRKDFADR